MGRKSSLRLPQLIDDGMFLQRDQPIKVWGYVDKGVSITISFVDKIYETVGDDQGKWEVELKPLPAGGPYQMKIEGDRLIVIRDILIGDVWLCGGQSNMELPIARVMERYKEEVDSYENPFIRIFRVPMVYDFKVPKEELGSGEWQPLTRINVLDFTAIGYFFAKILFEKYHVPIGLIHTAVGGTPIEAWISEEALKAFPMYIEEIEKYREDDYLKQVLDGDEKRIGLWQKSLDRMDQGMIGASRKWFDPLYEKKDWSVFNIPGFWNKKDMPITAGVIWFRKEINVPVTMLDKDARLLLGTIVDSDTVYLNGQKIGETAYRYPPRIYPIPKGVLREGENILVIRVICWQNEGGFTPNKMYGIQVGDQFIDLMCEWDYKIGAEVEELSPQIFLQYKPLGLYNGMIAPLKNVSLKGIIWYQGESNTGRPKMYKKLFKTLVGDWRSMWQNEALPFIYVQLPNFNPAEKRPSESMWAELRQAQFESLEVAYTGMAVTIDVGEWNDLHPLNKKDIGERLALIARAIAYHEAIVYSGPLLKEARLEENTIIISFRHIGSGLWIKGEELKGFALSSDGVEFIYAKAKVQEEEVVVWHESILNPIAVRYAWADNPEGANLYNKESLPASPFNVIVEPSSINGML